MKPKGTARLLYAIVFFSFAALLFPWGKASAQQGKQLRKEIRLGNHAIKEDNYKEAEIHYRKALQADPYNVEALYNLGGVLAATGKPKEAMEEGYEQALRRATSPAQKAMIYHNIGDLYMAQKNYAAAIDAFKNSLRNEPTNNGTRYNLALAQKLLKENPPQEEEQQQQQQEQEQEQEEQKQQPDPQQDQPPTQPEEKRDEMDRETAEQLLKAAMQDERKVQEKMKRKASSNTRSYEKDW